MTDPLTAADFKAAESLAPDLVKAGARWTGRRILSTPVERNMQSVYTRAIARLLAEVEERVPLPRPATRVRSRRGSVP